MSIKPSRRTHRRKFIGHNGECIECIGYNPETEAFSGSYHRSSGTARKADADGHNEKVGYP